MDISWLLESFVKSVEQILIEWLRNIFDYEILRLYIYIQMLTYPYIYIYTSCFQVDFRGMSQNLEILK